MRDCVAPMLVGNPSIRELAIALRIDKTLAWQVHQIASAPDPTAVLMALPGQSGMSKVVRALHGAGRDVARLEAARGSLVRVLARRGISRSQLKSMATGHAEGDSGVRAMRQLHRRAYEANSAVQGRSIGGIATAVMLMPAGSRDRLTLVAATLLHRMVRTVVSGPIPIYYRTQPAGSNPRAKQVTAPSRRGSMASLVRQLCSAEIEDGHISVVDFESGEALCYDPPASCGNRVDFAFREIGHGVANRDRGPGQPEGTTNVTLFNPTEHVVVDFMPHRDLHVEDPSASLCLRNAPDIVCKGAPEFLKHPIPIDAGWVSRRSLPAPFVSAAARWEALVEGSARAVNASTADFRTFRIRLECPPTPSDVLTRWAWADTASK